MWQRRSWFSLKGKAGIPGQTEGRPATSIGPRVPPVGSLQQRGVQPKQRPAVVALLKTIFAQETAEAAREQWAAVADALRERFPTLADLMDGSREDVLVYMSFPREHWAQIASTNPLERLNREIKRRADVVGIFPNDPAVIRLVGALMLEQNDEWAVSRRYMSLESLSALSDDPGLRLSAVAA